MRLSRNLHVAISNALDASEREDTHSPCVVLASAAEPIARHMQTRPPCHSLHVPWAQGRPSLQSG
ncbi:Hypothetical protein A7982_02706 [Minicystis rosea]|nr:Hypothetical protein A7982_02706 [Minicystis rosea]